MIRPNPLYLTLSWLIVVNNVVPIKWNIDARGWRELKQLEDNLCGLVGTDVDQEYVRGTSAWFCVPSANVSSLWGPLPFYPGTELINTCDKVRYNEGSDTCCYVGKISPSLHVPPKNYTTFKVVKDILTEGDLTALSTSEYKSNLYNEFNNADKADVLDEHEIGGLRPQRLL